MNDFFSHAPNMAETDARQTMADTGNHQDSDFGLSDLDHALAWWARCHGASECVARAFAFANRAVAHGHSCLALDDIPPALLDAADRHHLQATLAGSSLVGGPGDSRPLILDRGRLYLQRYHAYETRLAERLREMIAAAPAAVDTDRLLPGHGLFESKATEPAACNWQAVAAFVALRHRFTVISGGPGTGKTYTIVRLLRLLIETARADGCEPPRIALAAPTGKAAARMADAIRAGLDDMAAQPGFDAAIRQHIPHTARTLHRLLGLTGATTRPRFHADNPLPADAVIVDEASMVDLPMMAKLADAIRNDARLILLGDRYQLASVESGSVLAEICAHAGVNRFTAEQQKAAARLIAGTGEPAPRALADHVVTLQTSRRFNTDSSIDRLAAAVNAGDIRAAGELLDGSHDDVVFHGASGAAALSRLMDVEAAHYATLIEARDPALALAQLGRQCILTATRIGAAGSETINAGITQRLARRFEFDPATVWYHGRPVIISRNDHRAGLYNGDVGIALYNEDRQLRVWFPGEDNPRAFLPSALPVHATAYAMTIHKSQGSEFDAVTLVLPDHDVPVLTRELFYTGLTRGRHRLTVYAAMEILNQAMARRTIRTSGLAERMASGEQG